MPRLLNPSRSQLRILEIEEDCILYEFHKEAFPRGRVVYSLRAFQVIDFSSQYGSNGSISYTADNIVGPPTIFPQFGDCAYAFQARTYGEWWLTLPSSLKSKYILPNNFPAESQDFIEFKVERRILPLLIRIYEVYNPGAIVKLLCYCYDTEKWVVFWHGEPQHFLPNSSNCFTRKIDNINFITDHFRIEFHHKHSKYFFAIDGIIVFGEDMPRPSLVMPKIPAHSSDCFKSRPCDEDRDKCLFQDLPMEVMNMILHHLDLRSLCIASMVSKFFHALCYDPAFYKDLNLQLYWYMVDASTLKGLKTRLSSIKKLNLSWCGGQNRITPPIFIEFLENQCQNIVTLKISGCPFINNNCLKAIADYCVNLQELELQNCRGKDLTQAGFRYLTQIKTLKYLDLYRTLIDESSITALITNLDLEHLLLGSCTKIQQFNEVAAQIGRHLKNLKTLDLWRISSLNCIGMNKIAENLTELVEVDLGWCYAIDASCGCIKRLVLNCPKLKKLFLTAIRTLSDSDLHAISSHCKELEQLDLLGASDVTLDAIKDLLQNCRKLKLLDISYCNVSEVVSDLQKEYPHVDIKCSCPFSSVYY